jgi:hypothetical protein
MKHENRVRSIGVELPKSLVGDSHVRNLGAVFGLEGPYLAKLSVP